MITNCQNWKKNVHNYQMLVQTQNPFYMHQAPMVLHHYTKFQENQPRHPWEITLGGGMDAAVAPHAHPHAPTDTANFKIPSVENLWGMITVCAVSYRSVTFCQYMYHSAYGFKWNIHSWSGPRWHTLYYFSVNSASMRLPSHLPAWSLSLYPPQLSQLSLLSHPENTMEKVRGKSDQSLLVVGEPPAKISWNFKLGILSTSCGWFFFYELVRGCWGEMF